MFYYMSAILRALNKPKCIVNFINILFGAVCDSYLLKPLLFDYCLVSFHTHCMDMNDMDMYIYNGGMHGKQVKVQKYLTCLPLRLYSPLILLCRYVLCFLPWFFAIASSANFSFPFFVTFGFWNVALTAALSIGAIGGPASTFYIDTNILSVAYENSNSNICHS
jgi:hypothetical protein